MRACSVFLLPAALLLAVPAFAQSPDAATPPDTATMPATSAPESAPESPAPDTSTPPTQPSSPQASEPSASTPATVPSSDPVEAERATKAYNAGLAALKKSDWTGAAAQFESSVALSPQDAGARMLLGYARLKAGQFPDAVAALERARDDAAANPTALDTRSRVEVQNNLGIALWNVGRKPDAFDAYREALRLDSTFAEARYNLAFALLGEGKTTEALTHLTQLAARNPGDPALQDALGEAYETLKQPAKAVGAYKKAAQLAPKNANAQLRLALALLMTNRSDEALGALRTATKLDPNLAPAYGRLGALLLDRGRYKDAQEALSRYVSLSPEDFSGWYNLGVARDYSEQFDRALEAYAQAEKLNPNDPAVKNNIGRIEFKRKHYDEAIAKTEAAIALDSRYLYARHNLALALSAKGDRAAASGQWTRLIAMARDQFIGVKDLARRRDIAALVSSARAALAENALAQEKYEEAATQYRELLKQNPNNLTALSNLGLALYHAKNYAEAEAAYRRVTAKQPTNAIAHNNLGVMLEAQGRKSDALVEYRAALKYKADYVEAQANLARLTQSTVVG